MPTVRLVVFLFFGLYGLLALTIGPLYAQPSPGSVYLVDIEGIINPPVSTYLTRVLDDAAARQANLVVIRMDTPGGLETSMREMMQAILASPVPVVVYVSPPGAHAASAGLFILVSAHVAAMAPGTNTGSAHPVNMSGETDEIMASKVVNDAAATIRGIAERRGRNAEWAEQAVRESVSITASEALALNIIEIVANDLDDLLRQLNGRTIETTAGDVTLNLVDAPLYQAPMHFTERFLHVLTNPNIAFILLSVGSIGIIAELYNPGTFFPGITGAICLILAFYALGNLPTNWAGVALIILALVLFLAELNTDGTGILGTGAIIAFLLGGLFLFRPLQAAPSPAMPNLAVNPWLIGITTASMAGFIFLVISQLVKARHLPVRTGYEQFIGETGIVHETLHPRGRVRFQSQIWFAETRAAGEIPAGQPVRVIAVEGLTLIVEPITDLAAD
ncbi:MAG: nodulation protein NfeD [Anaerolineae bacterium]|nr:nodulation protein NfeD [Anaerolineae bacterium]